MPERGHPTEHPPLPVSRPTPPPVDGPGPLSGLRVVELAHEFGAFAGKLMADSGADVIVVEPPGGSAQRWRGAIAEAASADDVAAGEASLRWWADNTGKRSVVLDLDTAEDRDRWSRLVATADVVIECDEHGRLAELGIDHPDLCADNPQLIWVSITPYGRSGPSAGTPMTDLTMLAGGGPMWSCGYDDHDLPPIRGGGDQGFKIAGNFAMMSVLTALLARPRHGGQHLDLSMHAAANVTTEFASYSWLVAAQTVQRQTGRHATPVPSNSTQTRCGDGRYLNTGVPPRTPTEFAALREWLVELDLADRFPLFSLLEMSDQYELLTLQLLEEDPLAGEIFQAGRDAVEFIAEQRTAHEVFVGLQSRGIAAGVVWSPDEALQDPHFVERGFPTPVFHDQLGREVTYPGAPIRLTSSPMRIAGAAPRLGAHTAEVLAELDD